MNLNEVEKHVKFDLIFQLLIYIAIGLCLFLSLIVILATPAKAETISLDLTSYGVRSGQQCSTHPNNAFCAGQIIQGTSTNACGQGDGRCTMYMAYGTDNLVMSLNFGLNTSVHADSKVTITLKGPYFASGTYNCSTNVGTANNLGCRAIRTSSTSMNINFTSNSNPLSYPEFDVYQDVGNGFNPNRFFNITSIKLYETPIEESSGGSSGGSSGSTFDDSGIINNANDNTSQIIQNQDDNAHDTQNVIEGVGANIIKELANRCNNLIDVTKFNNYTIGNNTGTDYTDNPSTINNYSNTDGSINYIAPSDWAGVAYSSYIPVEYSSHYYLNFNITESHYFVKVAHYDSNFNYLYEDNYWDNNSINLCNSNQSAPCFTLQTSYIRFSYGVYGGINNANVTINNIRLNNNNGPFCEFGSTTSKLDEIGGVLGGLSGILDDQKDIQQDTYDYLSDDTDPSVNTSEINNVIGQVQIQDPLNYLLTLPLNLLTKLNTLISSGTCSKASFGELYGTEIYLPCINFENYLGSSLWGTIDTIVGIGLLVVILKKFYDTISNIISLGKEEEIRKGMELPTPMEFLAQILGGGK